MIRRTGQLLGFFLSVGIRARQRIGDDLVDVVAPRLALTDRRLDRLDVVDFDRELVSVAADTARATKFRKMVLRQVASALAQAYFISYPTIKTITHVHPTSPRPATIARTLPTNQRQPRPVARHIEKSAPNTKSGTDARKSGNAVARTEGMFHKQKCMSI